MNFRRILGIVVVVLGVLAILASVYIAGEVRSGRHQISRAQNQVDQGKQVIEFAPRVKRMANVFTDSAQKKIDQGRSDVNNYEKNSRWLVSGGIILIIIGGIFLIIRKK